MDLVFTAEDGVAILFLLLLCQVQIHVTYLHEVVFLSVVDYFVESCVVTIHICGVLTIITLVKQLLRPLKRVN